MFLSEIYKARPCFPPWVAAPFQRPVLRPLGASRGSRECLGRLRAHGVCSARCPLLSSSSPGQLLCIISVSPYLTTCPWKPWRSPGAFSVPHAAALAYHSPPYLVSLQLRNGEDGGPPALLRAVPTASGRASRSAGNCSKPSRGKDHGKWTEQVLK